MTEATKLLLIEDDQSDADAIVKALAYDARSARVVHAPSVAQATTLLAGERFDCILLDLFIPDSPGLEALWRIGTAYPDTPVIILTNTEDNLVESAALKTGAQDYLVKRDVDGKTLARAIRHAIDRHSRERRVAERSARDR